MLDVMQKLFILLFLSTAINLVSSAQGYIILSNNQKIRYDKLKELDHSLLVDLYGMKGKSGKREIPIDSVLGFYAETDEVLYYRKPSLDSLSKPYQFMKRHRPGRISLYEETIVTRTPYGDSYSSCYYMEKGDRFEKGLSTILLGAKNREKLENLKSLVSDKPEILKLIDENFKLDTKNLTAIVTKYNLEFFEMPNTPNDTSRTAELIIYKRNTSNPVKKITVEVNGQSVTWPSTNLLVLKVDPGTINKVCFGKTCDLLEASPYFKTYYALDVDDNLVFSLDRKTKKEATAQIKQIGTKPPHHK